MKNEVQLIAYVDRFSGGNLRDLDNLLSNELSEVFGGVHILPFFNPIDGADAGFDPIDHASVDFRLGNWEDINKISQHTPVMADLIINHVSSESLEFKDFLEKGEKSQYADLFLTYDKVFPDGATEQEILSIYRPRPNLPFTVMTLADRSKKMLWTTFTSQQIDIDVEAGAGRTYLCNTMQKFADNGVTMLRLDAVGYAIKRAGTSCFMMPETFSFIENLTKEAKSMGMEVLVEVHSYYKTQIEIAKHVDRVYDFALPPLLLHTLFSHDSAALKKWLEICPRNALSVLDTHDGIGVIDIGPDALDPNRAGLISPEQIDNLVETIHEKSGGISRIATGEGKSNLDIYQVNCSYYDALGREDHDYLLARLVQFFAPGIPQVYYMGLLAGENAEQQLEQTGVGRELNRRRYTRQQVRQALQKPVVKILIELIQFRNSHDAFSGEFMLLESADTELKIRRQTRQAWAELSIDFVERDFEIKYSSELGVKTVNRFGDFSQQNNKVAV